MAAIDGHSMRCQCSQVWRCCSRQCRRAQPRPRERGRRRLLHFWCKVAHDCFLSGRPRIGVQATSPGLVPVLAALDDAMLHVRRDQKADRGHDKRKVLPRRALATGGQLVAGFYSYRRVFLPFRHHPGCVRISEETLRGSGGAKVICAKSVASPTSSIAFCKSDWIWRAT